MKKKKIKLKNLGRMRTAAALPGLAWPARQPASQPGEESIQRDERTIKSSSS
jgi:hypothetical protein